MTGPLGRELRGKLATAVRSARKVAESGARAALGALGVGEAKADPSLSVEDRKLRCRLRAHARQLGDLRQGDEHGTARLVREIAYEHWHRMLFARFLAENGLLIEPDSGVAVSLDECRELGRERGKDAWEVAGGFAARMLPRIFRPHYPSLAVRLAPEVQQAREKILTDLPAAVFHADDFAGDAGGEPPLPDEPRSALLEDLGGRTGNDQLRKIHESRTELEDLRAAWSALADRKMPRFAAWEQAQELLHRAAGLPVEEDVRSQLDAIRDQRSLLDETDRVAPLAQKLSEALRRELATLHQALDAATRTAEKRLAADPRWTNLDRAKQDELRRRHDLAAPQNPDVRTDEALLRSLGDRPLAFWRAEADALPERTKRALADATAAASDQTQERPTTVTLRRVVLRKETEVRDWVAKIG